jgi:arylsulfatase A-like enzyme
MKQTVLLTGGISLLLAGCSEKKEAESNLAKPNIVFIYADDLGYGDLGCYGSETIKTPHLDQMAEEGLKFTEFYSTSPISSPSRAALLTGRYQVRLGITRVFFPNSLQGIDSSEVTIAEMLKEEGYSTGLIGKWHLGHLADYMPLKHGFDYHFGLPYSNDMEWEPRHDPPLPLYRNDKIIDQPVYQETLTQRYTSEAKNFIHRHKNEPFFLYFAHTFPHVPLYVSKEYKNSSPTLYGDVVQELDRSVGEVLETIKELGLEKNTMIVFSSDNGAAICRNNPDSIGCGSNGLLRGYKTTTFEGGIRVPTLAWWPGKIEAGKVVKEPAIMCDWLPTFAKITNAKIPQNRVIDGKDISSLIFGKGQRESKKFYFYHYEELQAIRVGDWKYIKPWKGDKKFDAHGELLFNINEDPYEQNNLIKKNPEKAANLKAEMDKFLDELGKVPEPKVKALPY